jgi:hypothetical protein
VTIHARIRTILTAGLFLPALSSSAQVQFGDLRMSMNGTIAPGYSATSGNQPGSASHSWTFGGASTLMGSYHSPNFFSFNAGLYLNQSRANSDFQSISNASGVDLSTTIFGGSEFPGNVGYSLAYNSDGNYGVPGLANYVTHGNSDTFSVGWSENIPDEPTFSAAFQMGAGQYTVYGANEDGSTAFHSLNLHSSYRLAGFGMGAYYSDGGGHSLIPEVITGESSLTTTSGDDSYGFDVNHRLPWAGSIAGGFNRSSFNTGFEGTNSSGTIDLLTAQANVHPFETVTFSASGTYSDNLSGQLVQQILTAGGVVPGVNLSQTSNSLDLLGVATYSPSTAIQTSFTTERRTQSYFGQNYGVTSYGVNAVYSHQWRRLGSFNSAMSAIDNSDDQTGDNTLGFSLTENYSGEFKDWKLNANVSYAQNVQTLLITYMNSFYNYAANAHRRWGRLAVSAGASAGRTALTDQAGTENDSQSYNATMGYTRWITATGTYARAHGQALATGAGLIPVPIPSPVLPSSLLELYGGNSYGGGLSSSPINKLVISASYAKSLSNTEGGGITSQNENEQYNSLLQYQVRKLTFTSGYARLEQGFSQAGIPPQIIVSYYAGISRWFKFF